MSPSAAGSGASGASSVFSGVSSLSTRDVAGPRDCRSGVFIVKGVDGAGDRGQGISQWLMWTQSSWPFWRTSRLGTIFLNCQNIRISVVSTPRLKEFCCTFHSIKLSLSS